MTRFAIISEFIFVHIFVTSQTIDFFEFCKFFEISGISANIFMALFTSYLLVFSTDFRLLQHHHF